MTTDIHIVSGSEFPGTCIEQYVRAVNNSDVNQSLDILKDAEVTVPHGVTPQQTMRGEEVKQWLEHRIKEQHTNVRLTSKIIVEGDTATATLSTSSDAIPSDIFPEGFYTKVTVKCSGDKLTQFNAEPVDAAEWNKLVEKRRSQQA